MKKILLLLPLLIAPTARAERVDVLVELSTDLCQREAEAQASCAKRGESCFQERQEHEACYKALPSLVAPVVAPMGLKIDPEYAVDYTAVEPGHYILRGSTCSSSESELKLITDALKGAGYGVSVWVSGPVAGGCP